MSVEQLSSRAATLPVNRKTVSRLPFAIALTAIYALIAGYQILHHVMWLDEWQAWLLVRASPTLGDLFENMRYETHPPLWHLCLWPLARLTHDARAMQLFHLSAAAASVFVVARYSPFSRIQSTLMAFGYFFFYEYSAISRCYVLGLLLALIAAALYSRKGRVAFYAVLVLLAQTSAFGVVLAVSFAATDLFRVIFRNRTSKPVPPAEMQVVVVGLIVLAIACGFAYSMIVPKWDADFLHHEVNWKQAFVSIIRVWVPIPVFRAHFLSTEIFDGGFPHGKVIQLVGSGVLLAAVAATLWNQVEALTFFFIGCLGTIAGVKEAQTLHHRHTGTLLIVLVAACWLAEITPRLTKITPGDRRLANIRRGLFTAILVCQIVPSVWAFYCERKLPFAESRDVGRYIAAHFPADTPIIVIHDLVAPGLSGYFDRPIYNTNRQEFDTFLIWDRQRVPLRDPYPQIKDLQSQWKRDVVLVYPARPKPDFQWPIAPGMHVEFLKQFRESIDPADWCEVAVSRYTGQ